MQVGSELLQGFLRPRGGQVEADKLQGGVPLQQHLTLMSGHHCWQGSFLRSARVLVGLLSCLSPGCLAVVGKEMIPHQLAGERLLKGGLRAQWGLKLATERRVRRRRLLLGRPSWELKKKRHTARNKDCIGDSESGPEWPGRGLWTTPRALTRPTAAGLLLLVSLAVASGVMGVEFSGDSGHEQWAELVTGSSGWSARGWLWAAKERTVTLTRWLGPGGRAAGRELPHYMPLTVAPGPSRGWRRGGWLQDVDQPSRCLLLQLTVIYAPAACVAAFAYAAAAAAAAALRSLLVQKLCCCHRLCCRHCCPCCCPCCCSTIVACSVATTAASLPSAPPLRPVLLFLWRVLLLLRVFPPPLSLLQLLLLLLPSLPMLLSLLRVPLLPVLLLPPPPQPSLLLLLRARCLDKSCCSCCVRCCHCGSCCQCGCWSCSCRCCCFPCRCLSCDCCGCCCHGRSCCCHCYCCLCFSEQTATSVTVL